MKKIITYILIGLLLAISTEMFRFLLVATEELTGPWVIIIINYAILFTIGYYASKHIKNNLIYYLVFGTFGLILETFFLGILPQIIAAGIFGFIAWFSFWGSIFLIPRLYINEELDRRTLIFIFSSLLFFTIFYLVTKNTGSSGLFFVSLNVPYILWHFKKK